MAEQQWPPSWWPFPLKDDSWLAVIPYMDAMQWLYESAKQVVNMIPHQPPEFSREVPGYILSLSGTREKIVLGTVGYNAQTRKVTITTNTQGGTANKTINLEISVIFPMLTVLLSRLPWDIIGELNNLATSGMTDAEKSKYAANGISDNKMIIRWLTDKVRMTAGDNGISMPALNGNYASTDKMGAEGAASLVPSTSNLVLYNIPVIDYCQAIYDAVMELVETINHHPPAAVFPVISRGFYPVFRYELHDSVSDDFIKGSDKMFTPEEVAGRTLVVTMKMYADNSVTDWNDLNDPTKTYDNYGNAGGEAVELCRKSFSAQSCNVVFTSTTNEAETGVVKGQKLYLPNSGASVLCADVIDIQYGTPGEGEEGDEGYIAPAPTVMTLKIYPETPTETALDIASVISSATMYGTPLKFEAVADTGGALTIDVGASVTSADFPTGVQAVVSEVIALGADEPSDADDTETGEGAVSARVKVKVYNTTGELVELPFGSYALSIDGNSFTMTTDNNEYLSPAPALQYVGTTPDDTELQIAPTEISVQVASPLYNAGTFFRWQEPDKLKYVGRELNLQLGTAGVGVKRYVLGRIKYKKATDKKGHYTYVYGDDTIRPDGWNCHPMDIKYDASKKIVTFVDRLNNDTLDMRLSACVWFAMQILMLIPVTVI